MLVLASNSPRRKQLLSLTGWDFVVLPAPVDESVLPGEQPQAYVRRLAEAKARAVISAARQDLNEPVSRLAGSDRRFLVIAADTAVVDGTEILGKPADEQEAKAMLRSLRGRSHQVFTGLAVLEAAPSSTADGRLLTELCVSEVVMRAYSDAEMMAYVASGDPLDKAGAYAIQHAGFRPVERLQGCYANVMGLPVCHLVQLLAAFGIYPENDVVRSCQAVFSSTQALDIPCEVYAQITTGAA